MTASTSLTLRPVPSTDRCETSPILANRVVIADVVTASYADAADEEYPTFAAYLEAAEASASELLGWGDGEDTQAISALREEAAQAGDGETVALCRRALEGDAQAIAAIADQVLDAKLAALD